MPKTVGRDEERSPSPTLLLAATPCLPEPEGNAVRLGMHIHGPKLLQTERHEYLKSTFSVSVMSVETCAITLWKAGSLGGEITTFLSFKSNKLFHLQGLVGN